MNKLNNPLVSVIMPSFNSSKHIEETVNSVLDQSFSDWELIIVDDCSSDNTVDIVEALSEKDNRIRLFKQSSNMGAASARNVALEESTGRYIAYLDSDDLWRETKLEKQIEFMQKRNSVFSCASYEVIDEDGAPLGKKVLMMPEADYEGFLTNNLLQTVGIMVDTSVVCKDLLLMPNLRRRQDAATWLQVLKNGYKCDGISDVLCEYRRVSGSLSSNKFKAAAGVWHLYRGVEKLPMAFSIKCFARYAVCAIWKRTYKPSEN